MKAEKITLFFISLLILGLFGAISTQFVRAELFDDYQRYIKIRMLMFKVMNLSGGTAPVPSGPTPTGPVQSTKGELVDSGTKIKVVDLEYTPGKGTNIIVSYTTTAQFSPQEELIFWLQRPDGTFFQIGTLLGPSTGNVYSYQTRDSILGNLIGLPGYITKKLKTEQPKEPSQQDNNVVVNLIVPTLPTPTP